MQVFSAVIIALFMSACGSEVGQQNLYSTFDSNIADEPFWPVNKPGDDLLNQSHALHVYFIAAKAKKLPANYFRDIIRSGASVSLRYADWPRYQPRGSRAGTIYHPMIGKPFSAWKTLDWSSFYNELFHAWWGTVFTVSSDYASDRRELLTSERRNHYRKAHRTDPLLAQEEAYSETIASLALYFYPKYNPHSESKVGYFINGFYEYNTNKTVSPVGHSDRPGYSPAAETTFPNCTEYQRIFQQLTDTLPPSC